MKITKCNCAIKCDADGCGRLAEKEISFNGVSADLRLCPACYETLCRELSKTKLVNGRERR